MSIDTHIEAEEAVETTAGDDISSENTESVGDDISTENTESVGDDISTEGDDELPAGGVGSPEGPSLRAAIEAVMLVVDTPVDATMLAQVCERPPTEVEECLRSLAEEYAAEGRGIALREVAGGWRFYTREECAPVVERFVRDGQQTRLTQAALETLAVVAYRQPVSRSRVSAVRGVNVDGVMRTLLARGLVEEAGAEPESGATLYRTTNLFLEKLGLNSLDELPPLAPLLPDLTSLEGDLDLPSS